MKITLPVSVEDVFHGKVVEAEFLKKTACQKCKGTGSDKGSSMKSCPSCAGNGFTLQEGMNHYGQRFASQATCQACKGWGKQITKACPHCKGQKIVKKLQKIQIKIPQGLPNGNVIKIKNFGDEQIVGAPSDLQVTIIQIPTQKWSRNKNDLVYNMQISFREAIFGFEKQFLHLNGQKIKVSRSEVTHKDTIIRERGKGIINKKTGQSGTLIIKFKIKLPNFNDDQYFMWEQFFKKYSL